MKKANPPIHAKASQSHINDASGNAQRLRLLARLKQGSIDTFTAIRELNILRPSARISELRSAGYFIQTQLVTQADDQGRSHDGIALYYLSTETDSDKENDE